MKLGTKYIEEKNCLNNLFHILIYRLQTAPNWWYEITWFSPDKILFCSVHPCHCLWELNWKTACQGDGAEKSLDFFDKMVSSCLNCLSFKEVRWNLKLPYNRGEAKSHGRFLFNVAPSVKHSKVSLHAAKTGPMPFVQESSVGLFVWCNVCNVVWRLASDRSLAPSLQLVFQLLF